MNLDETLKNRAKWRYRGDMVVTCPETKKTVGVHVDTSHAGAKAAAGKQELRLKDCTRWPERQDCGQECLAQIENQPENCQVRMILTDWYAEKNCVFCGKPFKEIHWHDHKPGLLSPERELVDWQTIPVETVPAVLETHMAVCWDCNLAETFRREHPELVTDRPWRSSGKSD